MTTDKFNRLNRVETPIKPIGLLPLWIAIILCMGIIGLCWAGMYREYQKEIVNVKTK